jgi:hypothetical protein
LNPRHYGYELSPRFLSSSKHWFYNGLLPRHCAVVTHCKPLSRTNPAQNYQRTQWSIMWLYIPREYCLSSQESVDLIARYGLFFQNVELFVTLSGKPTPRPYSWRGWKTRPWMKLLYGVTLQPSTVKASMDAWIQSHLDFPVPTSQSQASKKELSKAHDQDSSLKPAELFAKYSQGIFLSKTSQDSFLTDSCQSYSENFPKWGSMRSGECFRQEMWVAPILEKESSSWATATTDMTSSRSKPYKQGGRPIAMVAEAWATPQAFDMNDCQRSAEALARAKTKGGCKNLREEASSWPTPCSTVVRQGYQDRSRGKKGSQESLTTVVLKGEQCNNPTGPLAQAKQKNGNASSNSDPTLPQPLKKRLNPNFVEWLMGVPVGWSLPIPIDQNAYKRWETESSRLLAQLH